MPTGMLRSQNDIGSPKIRTVRPFTFFKWVAAASPYGPAPRITTSQFSMAVEIENSISLTAIQIFVEARFVNWRTVLKHWFVGRSKLTMREPTLRFCLGNRNRWAANTLGLFQHQQYGSEDCERQQKENESSFMVQTAG